MTENKPEVVVLEKKQDQRVITVDGKLHGTLKTKITATAKPKLFLGDGKAESAAEVALYAADVDRWTVQFTPKAVPGAFALTLADDNIDKARPKKEKGEETPDEGAAEQVPEPSEDDYDLKQKREFDGKSPLAIKYHVYFAPADPGEYAEIFGRHKIWLRITAGATPDIVAASGRPTGQSGLDNFIKEKTPETPVKEPEQLPASEPPEEHSGPASEEEAQSTAPVMKPPETPAATTTLRVADGHETDEMPYEKWTVEDLKVAWRSRNLGPVKGVKKEDLIKGLREKDAIEYTPQ